MTDRASFLHELASRYVWWVDDHAPTDDRVIAQVMNIGTYDDICRLEAVYTRDELRGVMLRAAPGWISDPSWVLWRGRLIHRGAGPIPVTAPRRSFLAEML